MESNNNCQNGFIAHYRKKDEKIQTVCQHLQEVACLTAGYASKIGLERHGELIGLLHDLGKASLEFKQYIESASGLIGEKEEGYINAKERKGQIDHSSAGAQLIYWNFSEMGSESLCISQVLALAISSHHTGLIDCLSPEGEDNFTRKMSKSEKKTRVNESFLNLDECTRQKVNKLLSDYSLVVTFNQKLKLLLEEKDSADTLTFKIGLFTRFLFSCLIDADRLNTADFESPELAKQRNHGNYISWSKLIYKLEKRLQEFESQTEVDKLRRDISNNCLSFANKPKGLYQLTVPTGGGKTLSSLRFALHHAQNYQMDRIFYIIPYTSIIDQNAQTVRKILEEGSAQKDIVLEYHSNLTPEEENDHQKLLSENWDAPVIFTTMVQFLETFFGSGTRSSRRMHQMANAVIIFDEIQTIPISCIHLFNLVIRFLINFCGATIVLCTATQPLLDKIKPDKKALRISQEQQIMPNVQRLFQEFKRVDVYDYRKTGGWSEEDVSTLVFQELQESGSVLIIVNTKKSAVNLYKQIQDYPKTSKYHLSTNMCPAHRMEALEKIKQDLLNDKPIICVSTQLIEAGVDIDFATVIRYLAGLDSIAQAAGRCNRNGKPKKGRVFIVNPKDENLDKLKDIKIGRDISDRILDDFKADPKQFNEDTLGLKAIKLYYEYYFFGQKERMCYPVKKNSLISRDDNLFELLANNRLSVAEYRRKNDSYPQIPLRQSFMTASKIFEVINTNSQGIIVPYGIVGRRIINDLCAAKNLEQQYKLLKEAQRYSVNVFRYQFDELVRESIIRETQVDSGVFYLEQQFYSNDFGLSTSTANDMEFLNC